MFGLYRCLTKKDGDADVVTEVKEFRKNVVAGGLNAADPITDSVNAFTIAKACSGQAVALIYFVLVAVSSVCATYAVGVNVQQARSLKKDLEGIKLGDDALEQQEADLAKKYPKVLAEGDESLMQKAKAAAAKAGVVQPVSSSAAPEDPAVVKEKAALSKLLLVLKLRLEVFQKKRQKKRVIAAVIQVFVEDLPITIVNVLFLVYKCSLGFLGRADEDELTDDADDAGECGTELTKAATVTFVMITVATTALMTKKVTDAFALGDMMKQVKTIEETQIPALLSEARALLDGDGDADTELQRAREDLRREKKEAGDRIEFLLDRSEALQREVDGLRRRGAGTIDVE